MLKIVTPSISYFEDLQGFNFILCYDKPCMYKWLIILLNLRKYTTILKKVINKIVLSSINNLNKIKKPILKHVVNLEQQNITYYLFYNKYDT